MAGLFRSLSQRFRRSKRYYHPGGDTAGTSEYQQGFDQPEMNSRKHCQCKVLLLDGTDMNIVIPKNAAGRELYDQVFYALDLEERDYFGLQFMDHYHVQHWLDPVKRINKQVPIGPPYTFRFRVKFYSSEPNNLREELTRYQFFLQLKQDIQTGKLECPKDTAIELAAFVLQSELGDYNSVEHTPALISEFRFHPEQDEEMEIAILEKFITCRGQSPATAEINYLNKAKWIELYGVDMHTVEGKDGNLYSLGLTPTGMLVFDGVQKIGLFLWEKIQKLDFKNRKITLVVEEDADQASGQVQLHTFVFNLSSHKACKHLWKCAIEHHTFFRLKYHKPRIAKTSQLFRLGSTFRYRGRTEYENVHKDGGRLSRRQSATFERRPSQRYGPRQSLMNKRIQLRNDFKKQIGASVGLPVLVPISLEGSCTAANNDTRMNSNGIASSDNRTAINVYANSSGTDTLFDRITTVQNVTSDEQINDIRKLDKSPSISRKQYSSTKDLSHSKSIPLKLIDGIKESEVVDTSLNMVHDSAPRWPELPTSAGSVTATIQPATSHVTRIAISNNGSQGGCASPPYISLQDASPVNNSNSASPLEHIPPVSTAAPNTRQSLISRNVSENSSGLKSSGSSISNPTGICKTSPSKTYAGSLTRPPLSSMTMTSLNQTFLPAKEDFQNSTVINGNAHPTITSSHSSIQHPSVTSSQNRVSNTLSSTVSVAPSSSDIVRTGIFTTNDRKLFRQTEYDIRSDKSNTASASRLRDLQSRIPHLRAIKCSGTTAMRKICIPAESAMQTSTLNFEPVEAVVDKTYRSRLPVRSGHASGSSTIASDTHESRTSTCDEKISQSRIPVMASSIHRPHSHTQLTSQMIKSEVATTRAVMASTNSRMITDL
uniref:Moesin/ezrin/radixin homolog 1 n=2 Tax=Onchocercidae TaxID=6296 RepID=A0AAF5RUS1_WUCBA